MIAAYILAHELNRTNGYQGLTDTLLEEIRQVYDGNVNYHEDQIVYIGGKGFLREVNTSTDDCGPDMEQMVVYSAPRLPDVKVRYVGCVEPGTRIIIHNDSLFEYSFTVDSPPSDYIPHSSVPSYETPQECHSIPWSEIK